MFDHRSIQLLDQMIQYRRTAIPELMRKLKLSPRQFHYDLEKLNDGLIDIKLPPIKLVDNHFKVDDSLIERWQKGNLPIKKNQLFFQETERVYLIYLYTFIRSEPVSNMHYQSLLQVSRNTALTDVKKVREFCQSMNVELLYNRTNGYHLKGTEEDKRRIASLCLGSILQLPLGRLGIEHIMANWKKDLEIEGIRRKMETLAKQFSVQFVNDRIEELCYLLAFIKERHQRQAIDYPEEKRTLVIKQPLYEMGTQLAYDLFGETIQGESLYITIQLLSAVQGSSKEIQDPLLIKIADEIIEHFERVTLITIDEKTKLRDSLYAHLVPAYFRIQFGIPIANPLIDKIKEEHKELFSFVKKALFPLEQSTQKMISDEEVGYFTLHFGGQFAERKKEPRQYRALIVCPNGISSSLMMRSQLQQIFPEISFSNPTSLEQAKEMDPDSYDMIFSTVYLASPKPLYLMQPLLSTVEKNFLIQAVATDFSSLDYRTVSVEELMEIIHRYADVKEEKKLYEAISTKLWIKKSTERRYAPMLSEILTKDMIQFTDEPLDWKTAIRMAAEPLQKTQKIQNTYIDAMIKKVTDIGAYIYLGKGIAIPHARPEEGVNQLGMSFLRTKTPVLLLDDQERPTDIFICLAAIDNHTHLKALSQLTKFLSNDDSLQALKEVATAEELIKLIKKGEEE
ncbi:BglG family transcription antiterminator [Bacillus sp. APMAM]|nr:BglG family transcription antiterminator [Bacillus sp. APMAM]RTZ55946.1 BglG family transcription antiterminator [Bacillus sp. SAJ1]